MAQPPLERRVRFLEINMPKRIYIPQDAQHSGIDVTWTKSAQRIDIGGWYDSCVGLQGGALTLREFFDSLGITEKDCAKAWKKPNDLGNRRAAFGASELTDELAGKT
jgi:hypothetical protein